MKKNLFYIITILLLLAPKAYAGAIKVVSDISPLYSLVANIMDGIGEPKTIIQHGASPHEYSMRPSEARALYESDLIFYTGDTLSPGFIKALKNVKTSTKIINLAISEGTKRLSFRSRATFEDHDSESHDSEKYDPHLWLSPYNAKLWLTRITVELIKADPENKETYLNNEKSTQQEIDIVILQAQKMLDRTSPMNFIVFHDAYQYFENYFGISAIGSIMLSDASAPTPSRLLEIKKKMKALNIDCAFSEPQFNSNLLDAITEKSRVPISEIDSLGSNLKQNKRLYFNLITKIAKKIAHCRETR